MNILMRKPMEMTLYSGYSTTTENLYLCDTSEDHISHDNYEEESKAK